MATEQATYRVVQRLEDLELREYPAFLVAETEVPGTREEAGNAGFRVLAAYIFGRNRGERKVAMTAPVNQAAGRRLAMTAPVTQARPVGESGEAPWVIQFTMPSGRPSRPCPSRSTRPSACARCRPGASPR